LAVSKRLADRGNVDSKAPLLDGYVRPDVIDELLLRDDLTRAIGKIDQNIQRPTAEGKRPTIAPEHPLANRKFERAEPQLPMNCVARHVSAKDDGFLTSYMPLVGKRHNCTSVKLAATKLVGFPQPLERTN
jgi:hypothetical protein